MITLIEVKNPLQPSVGRVTREIDYDGGTLLSFLVLSLGPPEILEHLTVSLNGHVWERSLWSEIRVRDNYCVVVTPALGNGSLLRTMASVGVMAASIAVGALTAGAGFALMGLSTAVTASMLAGAVSVAGNLLISAFLNTPSQKASSPSYAFDGPSSLAQSGTVVPKGYGTFLSGGNIIASFIDVEGNDQYINCLVCYGYGPARSITGIQINNKDIGEYGNVQYYTRLGSNTQTPLPNFNRVVNGYPQDAQCLAGVPVIVPGTGDLTQILNVDVVFPDGVWVLTNDNNLIPASITWLVEYMEDGSSLIFAGSTTSGSVNLVAGAYIGAVDIGTIIEGPGIPTGTSVDGFAVGGAYGTLVLSAAATATGSGTFTAEGVGNWLPALFPLTTEDVVTYALDGNPNPYPTWVAVATDLPPNSGVVYDSDSGSHYPGEPYSTTEGVEIINADDSTSTYDKTCVGEWQLTDPTLNQVQVSSWSAGYQSATFCTQTACYQRTTIYGLAPGKYDVRITKYGSARWGSSEPIQPGDNWSPQIGQDIWVHNINEISLLDLAYPNMILIGVRALATGQLSGSSVSITALIEYGLRTLDNNILPGALQAFEEDNPACVAADMMLDGLYGGGQWPGITAANIDRFIDEWVAWAQLNDELVDDGNGGSIRRHVFNGVFDNESNLWDQINVVGRMSRSQIIPLGRDYGVFLDQPDVPVQIFTMGNIGADSFNETWLDIDSRANQVEIQFADSTRYYRQDNPLVYMDPANQNAGVVIKNTRIDGKGVTIPAQAWHLARFKERCNEFLLRAGSFKCDVDAIASRPGNVAILQHDVPSWGWGGRTLPGSTASNVAVDRDDLPFVAGVDYSLIVLFALLERYAGTVTAAAPVIDVTGATLGIQLSLSSFDNANRVTRAVVATSAGVSFDSPIMSTGAGLVVIQPVAGFTAAAGQSYTLYDTDVLETATVSGISASAGSLSVGLGTPLSGPPSDYSTYFYGPVGTQKLIRILTIRKASEFRATIEWIDYNADVYVDATPIIGETSALASTNPGVTTLTGAEVIQLVAGSYIPYAALTWINGPDTVGVGIYAVLSNATLATGGTTPQMVARLTNGATSWQTQIAPGIATTFTVVGFDVNDDYAGFNSAPSVTVLGEGITTNLLLGSTFQTGFTYWSLAPRAGDALVPDLSDDGEATYTVAGTALTAPQVLLFQPIPQSKWAIGDYLMLSAYLEDSAVTTANVGSLQASIRFLNAAGGVISSVSATETLGGLAPLLNRYNTASTVVPALTAAVTVVIQVAGGSLSVQVGSVLTFSHLLLEVSTPTQTLPSLWADVDVQGAVLDYFTNGSSTGLRVQGSAVPTFTGSLTVFTGDAGAIISWAGLVILWPDGSQTYVADSNASTEIQVTALTASTGYFGFLFWSVVAGQIQAAVPTTPLGTPAGGAPMYLSAAYDAVADAACKQDGCVPLTVGGMTITTQASGFSDSGPGGSGTIISGRYTPPI